MHRRHFLQVAAAGSVSALAAVRRASAQMRGMPVAGMGGMMGGMTGPSPAPGPVWPTGLPLRRLGVLENTSSAAGEFEGTLIASRFQASLVAGRTTELWGYNSAFPNR